METLQIVAAGTAAFVAIVAFFQWRTAEQKAVLDLFDKRHDIYEIIRRSVGQMISSSYEFDEQKLMEFVKAMERAYFFFGDDVQTYLHQLRDDIVSVLSSDAELARLDLPDHAQRVERRHVTLNRISEFHKTGQPLFGKYMRFAQTVPKKYWPCSL